MKKNIALGLLVCLTACGGTAFEEADKLSNSDSAVSDTNVSDTNVSDTNVPDSGVPDNNVPDSAPDTTVPDNNVPDTSAPDTTVPDSSAPDTDVPDTNVPDTNVPDSSTPDTSVPDTNVPDTSVPDSNVPDTNVPDTNVVDQDAGATYCSVGQQKCVDGKPLSCNASNEWQQGTCASRDHGKLACTADNPICWDIVCDTNWGNCDGTTNNGCEANTLTDANNCGGCGIKCNGVPCSAGSCMTEPLVKNLVNPSTIKATDSYLFLTDGGPNNANKIYRVTLNNNTLAQYANATYNVTKLEPRNNGSTLLWLASSGSNSRIESMPASGGPWDQQDMISMTTSFSGDIFAGTSTGIIYRGTINSYGLSPFLKETDAVLDMVVFTNSNGVDQYLYYTTGKYVKRVSLVTSGAQPTFVSLDSYGTPSRIIRTGAVFSWLAKSSTKCFIWNADIGSSASMYSDKCSLTSDVLEFAGSSYFYKLSNGVLVKGGAGSTNTITGYAELVTTNSGHLFYTRQETLTTKSVVKQPL